MHSVLIDNRGKLCEAAVTQLEALTYEVDVAQLADVDMRWEGQVSCFVELKTAVDLVGSLGTSHMQDQEARLIELDGARFVVIVGDVLPASNGGCLAEDVWWEDASYRTEFHLGSRTQPGSAYKRFSTSSYPYAGVVNYQQRLQELGIGVVHVPRVIDLGVVLAALINRSHKATSMVPMRRRVQSLDPRVSALKSLPEFRSMPAKACEALVREYWRFPLDLSAVGEKDLLALPGVGRKLATQILGASH